MNPAALVQGRLAYAFTGVILLLACLSLTNFTISQVSATEYNGVIELKNTSPLEVTIIEAYATVKDPQGTLIASIDVPSLPITLKPSYSTTLQVPLTLSESLETLGGRYTDSTQFTIHGHAEYRIGFYQTATDIDFTLTRAEAIEYARRVN